MIRLINLYFHSISSHYYVLLQVSQRGSAQQEDGGHGPHMPGTMSKIQLFTQPPVLCMLLACSCCCCRFRNEAQHNKKIADIGKPGNWSAMQELYDCNYIVLIALSCCCCCCCCCCCRFRNEAQHNKKMSDMGRKINELFDGAIAGMTEVRLRSRLRVFPTTLRNDV